MKFQKALLKMTGLILKGSLHLNLRIHQIEKLKNSQNRESKIQVELFMIQEQKIMIQKQKISQVL